MRAHASFPPGPGGLASSHEGRQSRDVRNTAEPSRELSVGDVVAVGEAGLAVGRVGWTPFAAA
jgi:hypothetical protein